MILNELHLYQIILHFLYCYSWFATSFLLLITDFSSDTVALFHCLFITGQVPSGGFVFAQLNMF